MKPPLLSTVGLLAVLLVGACTSAETEAATQPVVDIPSPTPKVVVQPPVNFTSTPPESAQPVATSRGPNLEATDPATVSLASGQIQFVEFFRFT